MRGGPAGVRVALQALQVGQQVGGGLVADAAVLLERLVDDAFQFGGQFRVQAPGRYRGPVQDGIEDDRGGSAGKRQAPCRHLVEDGAEGKEIGAGVKLFAPRLLGRHIGHCAESDPGAGQVFFGSGGGSGRGGGAGDFSRPARPPELRQAEIQQLGLPAASDEDVGGLDVPVHDALGVGGFEGIGDLSG